MINNLLFFICEAIIGMKRSALMIIISKITILVSLLVFGFFLIVNINLSQLSQQITEKLEISIFLKQGITKREMNYFVKQVNAIDNVLNVTLVDKKDAWKNMKKQYENLDLQELVSDNPLPHSLIVKVGEQQQLEAVVKKLNNFSIYFESLSYGGDVGRKIQKLSLFIHYFGWFLIAVLSLATFLIMVNTIRLTIINRADEISIMKLVGATDGFIMGPFIFEGLILGIISSLTSVILLGGSYNFIVEKCLEIYPFLPIVYDQKQLFTVYLIVVFWGVLLSCIAAFLSLRGTLKKSI
ncbi:hypothetical protein DID76_00670 [Candidatus Marinamargulisbacteria bacterium SCGC AG-414-C22]|nr:hypothetical protein DID76_00670 [Candidatus Marinamargulisbacteria bacterium SCGC AG-414-C22]